MVRLARLSAVVGLVVPAACDSPPRTGEACDMLPGDLVISELMANPFDDPDTGHEWFEVFNASSRALVLDRLVLLRLSEDADGTVEAREHWVRGAGVVAAGDYFVFGDGVVGVQPIDYSYRNNTENFGTMSNATGGIGLRCRYVDNRWVTVDEVWYSDQSVAALPAVEEGHSLSFDGGVTPDHLRNDDGELWCSGGSTYDTWNVGSPGRLNIACGLGACNDGGALREVVRPRAGDLIVSEVFGDAADNDTNREWIEVYVAGPTAVDLNGLTLTITRSSTREARVTETDCVRGEPGDYLIIAGSDDPLVNGGVTVDAVAEGLGRADGMLFNTGGTLELGRGRAAIDTAEIPAFDPGVSKTLDPLELSATGNDLVANFCNSQSTGVFDEVGTPGQPNDPCGSACYDGGALRRTDPPGAGELVVTEVYPDAASPGGDTGREWIEVYVTPGDAVDVNGLVLELQRPAASGVERTLRVSARDCITVPGDTYVVIGGALAGGDGVVVDAIASGDALYNETCDLALRVEATAIDSVRYEHAGAGVSWSYSADATLTAVANDVEADWCPATDSGVFSATGSPGQANGTACP